MGNGILKRSSNSIHPTGMQATMRHDLKLKANEVPDGYCLLFAEHLLQNRDHNSKMLYKPQDFRRLIRGHTASNGNTCPLLALYTWHKNSAFATQQDSDLEGLGGPPGRQLTKARSTILKEFTETREFNVEVDQTIQILPVEDIVSIRVSTDLKKDVLQRISSRLKEKPPEELTCCENVKKCCMKNVCCCCDKEVPEALDYDRTNETNTRTKRAVVITIEYFPYGLLDTPSNVRLLSSEKQAEIYNKYCRTETLKFHYVRSGNLEENKYKEALKSCETLARIVMQLKGMIGQYPDDRQLKEIIQQKEAATFGMEPKEDIPMMETSSTQVAVRQETQISFHD